MINILLEGFDIDAPWLYDELKNYIQPNHSVAVVAFSFRDNRVKSLSDWNTLYSKECGKYHDGIVGGFTTYGIPARPCPGGGIVMEEYFQSPSPSVSSRRILYTASSFAKSNLIFLQETGSLKALRPHVSRRDNLQSYLCMMVLDGSGYIEYEGRHYDMKKGDCAFIDCMRSYSHSTGADVWSLQWVHFYGENMPAIYEKYIERGGLSVFTPENGERYEDIFSNLYNIAGSEDYLSCLLYTSPSPRD